VAAWRSDAEIRAYVTALRQRAATLGEAAPERIEA
jgi:hypothetical protein